jgi:hypothetical protein
MLNVPSGRNHEVLIKIAGSNRDRNCIIFQFTARDIESHSNISLDMLQ